MLAIRSLQIAALGLIAMAAAAIAQTAVPEVRAGGGGCHDPRITDEAATEVVTIGSCFEPSIARIEPGQSVTWANWDKQEHNVVGQNGSWGDYEPISDGGEVTQRFENAGTYAYSCLFHPGMIGVIVVGDGKGGGSVSGVNGNEGEVLASRAETGDEPDLVAPASVEATGDKGATDWLALAGAALAGVVVAGAMAAAVARRR
jgi:plastocyanin